ncbi:MAG: serine hydrolase, partial [Thermoanaerobaculia bacterium]
GKALEILIEPGTRFSYSGEGFVYLQHVVEAITNEPFDTFMHRTVFEPLGMTDSSYVWQPAYETQKAWGHDDAGTLTQRQKFDTPKSASTLHTTAADLGKFLSAVLHRTGISDQSVKQMLHTEVQVPEGCAMCATLKDPGASSTTIGWGLGWGLYSAAGHRYLWHWGDNGDFKAYVIADDSTKRGAVTLTNGAAGLAIAADVVAIAMGDPPGSIAIEQAPLDWAKYDRWDSPGKVALHDILMNGSDGVGRLRARADVSEAQTNSTGYSLLRAGHTKDAVEVFRLNTQRPPNSWNAWDSFGEGLVALNQREEAVTAYKKSVELNPGNESGKEKLSKLMK